MKKLAKLIELNKDCYLHLPRPPVFSGAASETPTAPPQPCQLDNLPQHARQRRRSRSRSGVRGTLPLLFGSTGFVGSEPYSPVPTHETELLMLATTSPTRQPCRSFTHGWALRRSSCSPPGRRYWVESWSFSNVGGSFSMDTRNSFNLEDINSKALIFCLLRAKALFILTTFAL